MSEIKDDVLQKRFIDASVQLAKIQLDQNMRAKEKELRMTQIWKGFKRFIDENYEQR